MSNPQANGKRTVSPDDFYASHEYRAQTDKLVCDLVKNGSIELTSGNCQHLVEAADLLPRGMSVYVPWHRGQDMEELFSTCSSLQQLGFDPVPHLVAALIPSRSHLLDFLLMASKDSALHRVLLTSGDQDKPIGPYSDSTALLKDQVLKKAGINEIVLAGYPEGHPAISPADLKSGLQDKLDLAARQEISASILTQFSFVPGRIIEYCSELQRMAPEVSVFVGMAGPVEDRRLQHFAQRCGVSASLRALDDLGVAAATSSSHTDPDEQLTVLARHCAHADNHNVIGVHMFSFGGFLNTVTWMRRKCRAQA